MAHSDRITDTEPTQLTHGDTIPAVSIHDLDTPVAAFPAAPVAWPWPVSVWMVLWSDGTVDTFPEEHLADDQLKFWHAGNPMPLSGDPVYAVAKREVRL